MNNFKYEDFKRMMVKDDIELLEKARLTVEFYNTIALLTDDIKWRKVKAFKKIAEGLDEILYGED